MERVKCDLCPNQCNLKDGQNGICGVRGNRNGKIISLTYGLFSAISLDPIEKKPLYHVNPGSRTLSLGSIGCNLKCPWCQNYGISRETSTYGLKELSPPELLDLAVKNKLDSVSFTYNEPLLNIEYIIDAIKLLKKNNIQTNLVTAGYINSIHHPKIFENINAVNIDLKSFSIATYENYIKGNLDTILNTIKYLVDNKIWTEITTLVIPELNDSKEEIVKMGNWICNNLGKHIPIHLSAFYPTYKMTDRPRTSSLKLIELRNVLTEMGLHYVYLGNVNIEDGSTTYCPSCKEAVIERNGYLIISNKLIQGKCPTCLTKIDGVFNH